jgi:ABC-2 type transport system ATP-binding protein/sodium transport system ATP-binding protein
MIEVENVTKRFGPHGRIVAVSDLSFHVAGGEVYGLLGPNGAGKTTTLRMILGLVKPDEGVCRVARHDVRQQPELVKSRIGWVTATDGLYPWLTVREILAFFAEIYGVDRNLAAGRIEHLSHTFDMMAFLDRRAANLSTGQKQRAILARGLIHDPLVVLLDEPTRGMDIIGSQTVFEYIQYLRGAGKAVVLSTHRLDEAERFCDRFGLLHLGRLRLQGTLEELRQSTGCGSLVEIFRAAYL